MEQGDGAAGWDVHDVVAHVIGTESMLQGVGTEADIDVSTASTCATTSAC